MNPTSILTDALDGTNIYLVVRFGDELAGFISLTPPEAGKYSIEKYFERADLPFAVDDGLYEVRLLTVARTWSAGRLEVKEVARRVLPYTLTASGQQLWMCSAQEMRTMSPAHRSGNPVQVVVEEYQVAPAVMKGRHIRRSVRA
jgi:hypothetical protein